MIMLFLALIACTGTETPKGDTGSSSSSLPSCLGTGFSSTLSKWKLPSGFQEGTFDNFYDTNSGDGLTWGLLNLSGELDLVEVDGANDIGNKKWLVYENSGSGFGPSATDWSLPNGFPNGTFASLSDDDSGDGITWGLLDMDGDGRVDLVQTEGDNGIGNSRWVVYQNNGSGFASEPTDWRLPLGFPGGTFDDLVDTDASDGVRWGLLDLDGDRAVDLVQTEGSNGIGDSKWAVFENSGSGFGPTATEWSLPKGFEDGTFDRFYDDSGGDAISWALFDINGDRAADIVEVSDDAEIGNNKWLVFENERDGFAASETNWKLPSGFKDGTFASSYDSNSGDDVGWALLDLDGSGAVDLVLVDGANGIGDKKWMLYANSGTGFGPSAAEWSLPTGFDEGSFDTVADDSSDLTWELLSLGQDHVSDLVVAKNAAVDAVGNSYWQVADAKCK